MTKVLIVVTNTPKYDKINRLTGLWLSELTHFYDVMLKNNIEADFASPNGGYVPLDPSSLTNLDEVDNKYYTNASFQNKALSQTLKPEEINPDDYSIIYYTGGHGTMWDFPESRAIADIASHIYTKGGIVSAVCHGVVGLLPVKGQNHRLLIEGKTLTGFSNAEEAANQTTAEVPFLTEDALIKAGANYQAEAPFTSVVRVSERLVTGQNPQSAKAVAEKVITLL